VIQYGSEINRKEKIMPKEKRNNLAIYTLAGSILVSSVIFSMNQSNAHSTSAGKREFIALKNCVINFQKETVKLGQQIDKWESSERDFGADDVPEEFQDYVFGDSTPNWVYWISDKLEC
jgi:hypothetical protein